MARTGWNGWSSNQYNNNSWNRGSWYQHDTNGNGRIDLVSDLIARTSTGADVTASKRMYGLVEGSLMWAWDLAAFGKPLQSYASAQLFRQEA